MKSTDKPKLSHDWWKSERPEELKSTELDKVLPRVEQALAKQHKKKDDPRAIEACLAVLSSVPGAAVKTIKQCDKKKHKTEITVLKRYDDLVRGEIRRLEQAQADLAKKQDGEEDEEENEEKIFQSEYLHKMIKLLYSTGKELNFAFGLDTKDPAASKLLLTRKGKPDRLFKMLKQKADFTKRLITYGKAAPDTKDGKTLVFKLADSAGEPPQIQKLGRQYLRSDKNLRFRKLKLILPGGSTLEDTEN